MCVNDLVVQGAEPLFFLDYFATGKLDVARRRRVVAGIAEGCTIAGCALVGGETAEMPGMYAAATTTSRASRWAPPSAARCCRATSRPATCCWGWRASGVHSNGFSLVRRVVAARACDAAAIAPGAVRRTRGAAGGRR